MKTVQPPGRGMVGLDTQAPAYKRYAMSSPLGSTISDLPNSDMARKRDYAFINSRAPVHDDAKVLAKGLLAYHPVEFCNEEELTAALRLWSGGHPDKPIPGLLSHSEYEPLLSSSNNAMVGIYDATVACLKFSEHSVTVLSWRGGKKVVVQRGSAVGNGWVQYGAWLGGECGIASRVVLSGMDRASSIYVYERNKDMETCLADVVKPITKATNHQTYGTRGARASPIPDYAKGQSDAKVWAREVLDEGVMAAHFCVRCRDKNDYCMISINGGPCAYCISIGHENDCFPDQKLGVHVSPPIKSKPGALLMSGKPKTNATGGVYSKQEAESSIVSAQSRVSASSTMPDHLYAPSYLRGKSKSIHTARNMWLSPDLVLVIDGESCTACAEHGLPCYWHPGRRNCLYCTARGGLHCFCSLNVNHGGSGKPTTVPMPDRVIKSLPNNDESSSESDHSSNASLTLKNPGPPAMAKEDRLYKPGSAYQATRRSQNLFSHQSGYQSGSDVRSLDSPHSKQELKRVKTTPLHPSSGNRMSGPRKKRDLFFTAVNYPTTAPRLSNNSNQIVTAREFVAKALQESTAESLDQHSSTARSIVSRKANPKPVAVLSHASTPIPTYVPGSTFVPTYVPGSSGIIEASQLGLEQSTPDDKPIKCTSHRFVWPPPPGISMTLPFKNEIVPHFHVAHEWLPIFTRWPFPAGLRNTTRKSLFANYGKYHKIDPDLIQVMECRLPTHRDKLSIMIAKQDEDLGRLIDAIYDMAASGLYRGVVPIELKHHEADEIVAVMDGDKH